MTFATAGDPVPGCRNRDGWALRHCAGRGGGGIVGRMKGSGSQGGIVVGVDLSRGACDAVWWALGEARRRSAAVILVHAPDGADAELAAGSTGGLSATGAAQAVLDKHLAHAHRLAPDVEVRTVLATGSAVDAMIEASHGAQVLVLGSRGQAGLRVSALGSVSQRVAVHARCPVVVVPTGSVRLVTRRVVAGATDTHAGRRAVEFATADAALWGAELVLVRSTEPARALIEESRISDLLVLGCHHTEDEFSCRLGAVPSAVLAAAECPVVLVG